MKKRYGIQKKSFLLLLTIFFVAISSFFSGNSTRQLQTQHHFNANAVYLKDWPEEGYIELERKGSYYFETIR